MADITEYENTNPENINEAFENLSGDVNYMVHKMKEFNKEVIELFSDMKELKEFVESLPQESFVKIRSFFDTMPRLKHDVEITNPKTGIKSKVTLTGIADFFELASPTAA